MNRQYRGSYKLFKPHTTLPAAQINCSIHDNPYIDKKEMKCVIGKLKKQVCKIEIGGEK